MFTSARIQLTAWYVLTIVSLSCVFSAVVYILVMQEFVRLEALQRSAVQLDLQQKGCISTSTFASILPPAVSENEDILAVARFRLLLILFLVNTGVGVLAASAGYVLAGKTLRPIQEMMLEQDRFVADASHELRTPLTALDAEAQLLLRQTKVSHSEAQEFANHVLSDVQRLRGLCEKLLDLGSDVYRQGKEKTQTVELQSIVREAIEVLKPLASKKQITLKHQLSRAWTSGVPDALLQVVVIVLDNALKYSPPQSQVQINLGAHGSRVVLKITDQGMGISPSDLPNVFKRFYRSTEARKLREAKGFGLGLSLAQRIVTQHAGTLEIESELDRGTTVTLQLPRVTI